ncbi:MAG: 16S rRNA (guanine(527)-N(7))-methyltransferase RsmG [Halarsenatibacteraceae bacterium]
MANSDQKNLKARIDQGLTSMNLPKRQEVINNLYEYLILLYEENQKYNLIGPAEPEEIITRHFYDSMAPLKSLNLGEHKNGLDLGTGAGLPGVVWKLIYPEVSFYFLDSRKKRVNFLKLVKNQLKLDKFYPLKERAERLGQQKDWREQFSFVSARAVASMDILIEYVLPLVEIGGYAYLFKGPDYKEELSNSKEIVGFLGGGEIQIIKIEVPELDRERYLIKIKKIKNTPGKYPRRVGKPKKDPLKKEDISI